MSDKTSESGKLKLTIVHRIAKFNGDPKPGDEPIEIIEITEELDYAADDCIPRS